MSQLSPILRDNETGGGDRYLTFWCPGCDMAHQIKVDGTGSWSWNGDPIKPTFSPSVLVRYDHWVPAASHENPEPGPQTLVGDACHSFIADGRIQFLTDCTHKLAGQTVDLPAWDSV